MHNLQTVVLRDVTHLKNGDVIEVLQGVVNKIRFSTGVNGGQNGTSTSHVAFFEIDEANL